MKAIVSIFKRLALSPPVPHCDLYSAVAKELLGLECDVSRVKELHPELREGVKRSLHMEMYSGNLWSTN